MLQIYSNSDIPWILVQGQPTASAERAFGEMRHEGSFSFSRLSDSEQRFVMREIRENEFARIPQSTAKRLLSTPTRMLKGRLTRWLPFRKATPLLA